MLVVNKFGVRFTAPFTLKPANSTGAVTYYVLTDANGKLAAQGSRLLCLKAKDELDGKDGLDIPSFLHRETIDKYPESVRDRARNRLVEHGPIPNDMNDDPLAVDEIDPLAIDADDPLAAEDPLGADPLAPSDEIDPLAVDEDPLA